MGNSTIREQLESVERQTGKKPKELSDLVELPPECIYVWKAFMDLNNARSSNGFGWNPIPYSEIQAYCSLYNLKFYDDEVLLLKKFDREVLKIYNEEEERRRQIESAKAKNK